MKPNSPAIESELARLGTIFFTMETSGTGVDLDRRARNRMRNRMRRMRRRQRRYQMLRDTTHAALGRLITRQWSYVATFTRERETGAIAARQMWRSIGKLFVVRARLGS